MQTITNSKLFSVAAVFVIAVIAITFLIIAKAFLIPLAWSLVIAMASFQMLTRIERKFHIKRLFSSLLYVAFVFLVIILLFYFFYREIASIIQGIPALSDNLALTIHNITNELEGYGLHIPMIDQTMIQSWIAGHADVITKALASFGKSIGNVFLIGVYLFFILYYRDNYLYFMKLREKTDDDFALAKKRSKETIGIITNFLYGLFVTTLMLAVMLYIVFLIIGLKYALFFAFLVALLTLLPYIGSPLGMAIVFVFASISNDGLMVPLLALAGIIISNAIKGNVIKPIVIGNKINLNAFMIFLSVITGGLIWGVSGMILFMPFAGIAKVLLEYNESTRPLTALFTILPKNALKPSVHSKTEEDQG